LIHFYKRYNDYLNSTMFPVFISCFVSFAVNELMAAPTESFSSMLKSEDKQIVSPPWSYQDLNFDEITDIDAGNIDYEYYIFDEAKVYKRDNSNSSKPSFRTLPRCFRKKSNSTLEAAKPSFRIPKGGMQRLAAGHLGHRVELFCPHRKGCPKANITWTKDGEVLQSRGRKSGLSTIRIKQNGELIIEDNRKEDDGNYTCIFSNSLGTIQHSIIVQSVPRVVAMEPLIHKNQPGNHTVMVGKDVRLMCELTVEDGSSTRYVGWYKHFQVDGKWMNDDKTPYATLLQESNSSPPPDDDQQLNLVNVTLNDTGWYSCRVSNQYGRLVRSGFVQVVEELVDKEDVVVSDMVYTYVSMSVCGVVGLSLSCVLLLLFLKYRREKKKKALAIRTAQCVVRWTKKIIIERDKNEGELCPIIRMEEVLAQGGAEGSNVNYEFQLDTDWELPRELLTFGEELGQGAFGRVLRGTIFNCKVHESSSIQGESRCPLVIADDEVDPVTVAVKMLKEEYSEEEVFDLVKEIEIMKAVGGHVNIVNLLGACTQPFGQPLYAVMEFAKFGNLRDHLRSRRGYHGYSPNQLQEDQYGITNQPISLREMLSFAWQVARGMQYLSHKKCVHRDLAARNVLIAEGGVAKIADFGLARDTQESDYYRKRGEGKLPVLWMSPESLFAGVSTTMSDVWSFGVLLWEIVTWGERPYSGVAAEAVLDLVKDGYRMSCPSHCPHQLYSIMRNCWHLEPSRRPSWLCLVDDLFALYDETLPGVYLDLVLPIIPTPPSSPESRSSIFSQSITSSAASQSEPPPPYSPGYMPGIAPLSCPFQSCVPTPPPPPPYARDTLLRRVSEESGYSSTTCHDLNQFYCNV